METIIIFGIPIIFLILFIRSIVKIIKTRKNKEKIKKSLIVQAIIFGLLIVITVIFYILIGIALSNAVAYM